VKISPGNLLEIIPADLLDTLLVLLERLVSEMTCYVSSGTSNLLTHSPPLE